MADTAPLLFERRLGGLFPACHAKMLLLLVDYDQDTGLFVWRKRPTYLFSKWQEAARWNGRYAGKPAFTARSKDGYLTGLIFKHHVKAHSVAWTFVHGQWPVEIDHINGDKADNRIVNLREVTRRENAKNRSLRSDNRTGFVGISQRRGKWLARIQTPERNICLGTFATIDEAVEARRLAELEHGYHENHGRHA